MLTCTRRIQFCAGHRVLNHESKCANLHGHNYIALIEASGELDAVGRVVDFSVLKERVGGWIDKHWDHATILFESDPASVCLAPAMVNKPIFRAAFNPTAENMADHLLRVVCPDVLVGTGVKATKVVLWETENCFATAELP